MRRTAIDRGLGSLVLLFCAVSAVEADETSDTCVVYSQKDALAPQTRTWDGLGWSLAGSTAVYGKAAQSVIVRNCPRRDETALGGVDNDGIVYFTVHDGTFWGSATVVGTDTDGTKDQSPYDLAYEIGSGDLLLCYWDKPTKTIGVRIWDGTMLSTQSSLTLPSDKKVRFLQLHPKRRGDEIMLLALNDDAVIYAAAWDGDGWGAVETLETDTGYKDMETFDFAWIRNTGNGLMVYGEKDQLTPRYRTWDGTAWSVEQSVPSVGKKQRWIRLAGDPASSAVIMASLDDDKDLNVNVWDGTSWGVNVELEIEMQERDRRYFDVAYESGGGEALIAYTRKDLLAPSYRTWDGVAWSGELAGPDVGHKTRTITLATGFEADTVWITVLDDNKDVSVARWDGASMSAATELEAEHDGSDKAPQVQLAVPARVVGYRLLQWTEVDPGG